MISFGGQFKSLECKIQHLSFFKDGQLELTLPLWLVTKLPRLPSDDPPFSSSSSSSTSSTSPGSGCDGVTPPPSTTVYSPLFLSTPTPRLGLRRRSWLWRHLFLISERRCSGGRTIAFLTAPTLQLVLHLLKKARNKDKMLKLYATQLRDDIVMADGET